MYIISCKQDFYIKPVTGRLLSFARRPAHTHYYAHKYVRSLTRTAANSAARRNGTGLTSEVNYI